MNAANIRFVFVFLSVILIRDCNGFLLETNLGKFIQNLTNVDGSTSIAGYESFKVSDDTIMSAFKGFLKIVDDPMEIKRSTMNYNIPDVVRSEGFVENLSVRYLKNATLNDVVYFSNNDTSCAALNLTFPLLKVAGWYNMTFNLDRHNVSIYGNGSFAVQLNNLSVRLNVTLEKTAQGDTVLNGIVWNQTLNGNVLVNVDNLLDDREVSAIFSENLSILVPTLHDAYKPLIDEFMAQTVLLYGRMLLFKSKRAHLETIIHAFASQQTA